MSKKRYVVKVSRSQIGYWVFDTKKKKRVKNMYFSTRIKAQEKCDELNDAPWATPTLWIILLAEFIVFIATLQYFGFLR